MLVCNVSLRAPRTGTSAITASVAEAATARDALGTGNVVFATLVDDPASVLDFVDAYLGQIMVEAANAAATINAGLAYAVAINEAAFALDASSTGVTGIKNATAAETASAADVVDSTLIAGAHFEGALALNGPIMPAASQPAVIYIEG